MGYGGMSTRMLQPRALRQSRRGWVEEANVESERDQFGEGDSVEVRLSRIEDVVPFAEIDRRHGKNRGALLCNPFVTNSPREVLLPRIERGPVRRQSALIQNRHSGIVDRHYFTSIYVREPNGVLFELASDGPGFDVDGPIDADRLSLPPFLEPRRASIEAALAPLTPVGS